MSVKGDTQDLRSLVERDRRAGDIEFLILLSNLAQKSSKSAKFCVVLFLKDPFFAPDEQFSSVDYVMDLIV